VLEGKEAAGDGEEEGEEEELRLELLAADKAEGKDDEKEAVELRRPA